MITHYPYQSLGAADHGWLKAHHHFSFASYHNPQRRGFGLLRVVNDDVIAPGTGFAPHPHRDMEIITYVRRGAISHADSEGNRGRTAAGDVQVMSAGSGVMHEEYNLEAEESAIYQIWIEPDRKGVTPRWESRAFPAQVVEDALVPLASGREEDVQRGALFIHQDATIAGGRLRAGTQLTHPVKYQAYLLLSQGAVRVGELELRAGDGAEITQLSALPIEALSDAEILVIDVPPRSLQ